MTYLAPEDIAQRLNVSRTTAYRIALKCIHVKEGRFSGAVDYKSHHVDNMQLRVLARSGAK